MRPSSKCQHYHSAALSSHPLLSSLTHSPACHLLLPTPPKLPPAALLHPATAHLPPTPPFAEHGELRVAAAAAARHPRGQCPLPPAPMPASTTSHAPSHRPQNIENFVSRLLLMPDTYEGHAPSHHLPSPLPPPAEHREFRVPAAADAQHLRGPPPLLAGSAEHPQRHHGGAAVNSDKPQRKPLVA